MTPPNPPRNVAKKKPPSLPEIAKDYTPNRRNGNNALLRATRDAESQQLGKFNRVLRLGGYFTPENIPFRKQRIKTNAGKAVLRGQELRTHSKKLLQKSTALRKRRLAKTSPTLKKKR